MHAMDRMNKFNKIYKRLAKKNYDKRNSDLFQSRDRIKLGETFDNKDVDIKIRIRWFYKQYFGSNLDYNKTWSVGYTNCPQCGLVPHHPFSIQFHTGNFKCDDCGLEGDIIDFYTMITGEKLFAKSKLSEIIGIDFKKDKIIEPNFDFEFDDVDIEPVKDENISEENRSDNTSDGLIKNELNETESISYSREYVTSPEELAAIEDKYYKMSDKEIEFMKAMESHIEKTKKPIDDIEKFRSSWLKQASGD